MNSKTLVSIIVPVHNAEETLVRCIESLENNEIQLQIILIENNSIDTSYEVCRKLEEAYSNVELLVSKKSGVSAARNKGLLYAKGKIIGFCDADDYYEPHAVDRIIELFCDYDIDMVISSFELICGGDYKMNMLPHNKVINSTETIKNIACNPVVMGSVWNKFYKRKLIDGIRFEEDLTHLEDGYFNYEILTKNRNCKILLSDIKTYNYIYNPNSTTSVLSNCYDEDCNLKYIVSLDRAQKRLKLENNEKEYIMDQIFKLSVLDIWNENLKDYPNCYNKLYDNIRKYFFKFIKHGLIFDKKGRIKILIKAVVTMVKGKK